MNDHDRQQLQPRQVGETSRAPPAGNSGRNIIAPNIAKPTMKPTRSRPRKIELEQPQRHDRLRARCSIEHERAPSSTTAEQPPRPMICGELQAYLVPPSAVSSRTQADRGGRAARRRGSRSCAARASVGIVQRAADDDQRDQADRDVDVEDPAPAEVIGEQAAEQRADHAATRRTPRRSSPVAAALARRDDVADDGHGAATIRPPPPMPWSARKRDQLASCSATARTAPSRSGR